MEPVILSGDESDLLVQRHLAHYLRCAVLITLGDDIGLSECDVCKQNRCCYEDNLSHKMLILICSGPPIIVATGLSTLVKGDIGAKERNNTSIDIRKPGGEIRCRNLRIRG